MDERTEPTFMDLYAVENWTAAGYVREYQDYLLVTAAYEERFANWVAGLGYALDVEVSA